MRKLAVLLSLVALGAAAGTARAQSRLPVPELLRVASRLTGVRARSQPRVVVVSPAALRARALRQVLARYPAATQSYDTELLRALGLLGADQQLRPLLAQAWVRPRAPVLDTRTSTVYVARGSDARGAALSGLVNALYAERYGLPAAPAGSSDEALALAAAAEGAAELAVRNLRTAQAAPTPSSPAAVFLGLEAQFVDALGLRLASTLLNVGGDRAVRGLLQRPPISTEQVLHVDKYLAREKPVAMELPASPAGFSLVRDDTFGELDVRALLAVFQVPRLDRVGSGWGGGLSAVYRDGSGHDSVALRLDWDTPLDAEEWAEAAAIYVNEAFDANTPGPPAETPCAADACWSVGGRSIAFVRDGERTALVLDPDASDVAASASLARSLLGESA